MPRTIELLTPLTDQDVEKLEIGDTVFVNGVIYTARDAAHKRLIDFLEAGQPLPVDLKGQIMFYVGPSPARPGRVIGAAGPTTSYRMDPYAPQLSGPGTQGHDRQGQTLPGGYRCHDSP